MYPEQTLTLIKTERLNKNTDDCKVQLSDLVNLILSSTTPLFVGILEVPKFMFSDKERVRCTENTQ